MALGLCLTQVAVAETVEVRAYVPFEFSVGNSVLPAGDYEFRRGPEGQLRVSAGQGRAAEVLYTSTARSTRPRDTAALVFRRYGDTFVLAEVYSQGCCVGLAIPALHRERELARLYREADRVEITGRLER